MRRSIIYVIALVLMLLMMSPGIETMQMLAAAGDDVARAWAIFLPSTVIYLFGLLFLNDRVLVPRLLFRGRFADYIVCVVVVTLIMALGISAIESGVKLQFDLPGRRLPESVDWFLPDAIGNAIFVVPLMVGLAMVRLYGKLKADMQQESLMTENLEIYMRQVRESLNPEIISRRLKGISEAVDKNSAEVSKRIASLSEYLRSQLAALPSAPDITGVGERGILSTPVVAILTDRRFRVWRHVMLIAGLLLVAVMAYGDDYVSDVRLGMVESAVLAVYLGALSYITIYQFGIYRRRHGNLKRYVRRELMLLGVVVAPMILSLPFLMADMQAKGGTAAMLLELGAMLAGIAGIAVYVGGLSALLLFQNWLRVQRHITLLRHETLRQGYLFLRKQINPHFLFNVLNNIEITACDDPAFASSLLGSLCKMLDYQFGEIERDATDLGSELDFLASYLALEQSRHDNFEYEIVSEVEDAGLRIPTLLFIPMVENAAKYYWPARPGASIKVIFRKSGRWLRFECHNPYCRNAVSRRHHGGIGLENTRRRLELMYDGRARMAVIKSHDIFSIGIDLPLEVG